MRMPRAQYVSQNILQRMVADSWLCRFKKALLSTKMRRTKRAPNAEQRGRNDAEKSVNARKNI